MLIKLATVGLLLATPVAFALPVPRAAVNPPTAPVAKATTLKPSAPPQQVSKGKNQVGDIERYRQAFNGGADSLVARGVGHAEGTRTADGGKTSLWETHTDPGDFKQNYGTFSYSPDRGMAQISDPNEADKYYLEVLREREKVIVSKFQELGISPTFEEYVNGVDLSNQAPLCITAPGNYMERLKQAKDKGLTGFDAIVEARKMSYCNPNKGDGTPPSCWDANGLRAYDDISKEESVYRDQLRRADAVRRALTTARQQGVDVPVFSDSSRILGAADKTYKSTLVRGS